MAPWLRGLSSISAIFFYFPLWSQDGHSSPMCHENIQRQEKREVNKPFTKAPSPPPRADPQSLTGQKQGVNLSQTECGKRIDLELINQDLPPQLGRVSTFSEQTATWKMNKSTKQDLGQQERKGDVDGHHRSNQ